MEIQENHEGIGCGRENKEWWDIWGTGKSKYETKNKGTNESHVSVVVIEDQPGWNRNQKALDRWAEMLKQKILYF